MKKLSDLFNEKPTQWGLRGDPYLWDGMKEYFSKIEDINSEDEFIKQFYIAFKELTGEELVKGKQVFVERYSKGGMSSGYVACSFWIHKVIPGLIKRFKEIPE